VSCPGFEIRSYGTTNGARYARFGETLEVVPDLAVTGAAPELRLEVTPAHMARFVTDLGGGRATFNLSEVDLYFATTTVSLRLVATGGGCSAERTAALKALGNLWVTVRNPPVVQVFRSDGAFIVQGISSTYLNDPVSLLQLAPGKIAVGNRQKAQAIIEVFDLDGRRLYSFQDETEDGHHIYSSYGAETMLRHQPDGLIWVGGPRGYQLTFDEAGTFKEKLHLDDYTLQARSLVQIAGRGVVLVPQHSIAWYLYLLDEKGEEIGRFAQNTEELNLTVHRGALAPGNHLVVAGVVNHRGTLALLRPDGQMERQGTPTEELLPRWGLISYGHGFLATTEQDSIAYYDADLNLVSESFTGEKKARYAGLMVLGGN